MKSFKNTGLVVMILILITTLTASAQGGWVNPGTGVADVVAMNVGTSQAAVTAEYIDAAGNQAAIKTRSNLPVNATHEFLASASGLPDGWQGAMLLSSTENVATVATVKWAGGVDAGDDGDNGQYTGVSMGQRTVYCPALYQNTFLYSTIAVQNTGTADAHVQIAFRDRDGTAYGSNPVSKTIKPNAQTTLNLSTDPAYFAIASNDGSAVITSDQPVAAVVTSHWNGRSSTYNCPTTGNTKLYVPAQFRYTNGGSSFNDYILYSANVLMNLSSTTAANVTFHYIPRTTGGPTLDVPISIPPLSAKGLNTFNGGSVAASTFDVLGLGWDGTVVIDSNQPLVGINNTNWGPATGLRSATFAIVGPADGSQLVYLPHQRRVDPGGAWAEWSAAIVQNLSTTNTANVTLRYYDANGVEKLPLSQAIAPGAAFGFNTRNGGSWPTPNDFQQLGDAYSGGLKVTADQPIAVVSQYITAGTAKVTGAAYNGVVP